MMSTSKAEREYRRRFASMGGNARAKKLSAQRRKEIAKMGVDARKVKRSNGS